MIRAARFCLFVFVGAISFAHPAAAQDKPVAFPRAELSIRRADGVTLPFQVEVASTEPQIEQGLMFRRSLAIDGGMLFVCDPPPMVGYWMKNTPISLDPLFIDKDGAIVQIISRAEPFSLTPMASNQPVNGVIEIRGGEAAKQDIRTGDKVIYPPFGGP